MTPTPGEPRLRADSLRAGALAAFDLVLDAGDCVAVLGRSGAGKTLLLRAIADLDPHQGECFVDGIPRSSMAAPAWRRQVAYFAAEPGFWGPRLAAHFDDPAAAAREFTALDLDPALLDREVLRLSTGERLRAALVRTLLGEPRVLLLDEPTGPLDAEATARVESRLAAARAGGAAIVWVTHDAAQARRVADRSLLVADGRVREAEFT